MVASAATAPLRIGGVQSRHRGRHHQGKARQSRLPHPQRREAATGAGAAMVPGELRVCVITMRQKSRRRKKAVSGQAWKKQDKKRNQGECAEVPCAEHCLIGTYGAKRKQASQIVVGALTYQGCDCRIMFWSAVQIIISCDVRWDFSRRSCLTCSLPLPLLLFGWHQHVRLV